MVKFTLSGNIWKLDVWNCWKLHTHTQTRQCPTTHFHSHKKDKRLVLHIKGLTLFSLLLFGDTNSATSATGGLCMLTAHTQAAKKTNYYFHCNTLAWVKSWISIGRGRRQGGREGGGMLTLCPLTNEEHKQFFNYHYNFSLHWKWIWGQIDTFSDI